jgi:ankyrin repeat protein
MSGDGNSSNQSLGALLVEELTEFCRSKSLSEDGLHEIIERHGVAPNDPNINNYNFFHQACRNETVTEGILRYLLGHFPNAVRDVEDNDFFEQLPLHNICHNKNVTLGMVQLLIDAFPDSVRHEGNNGWTPLHALCCNRDLDDEDVGLDIMKLLIERCPESVRRATRYGMLPLHFAAADQSREFCRILIEAYPGSERMADHSSRLPFHMAFLFNNTVVVVKYLYQLYPESINVACRYMNDDGWYPIHLAITRVDERSDNPEAAINMVQFLLRCDPNVASQKVYDKLPLYVACKYATTDENITTTLINAYLKVLQILYDAHPEAIESNEVTSNVGEFCAEVQTFINTQLTYAQQARDHTLMTTRDENGQLPLHKALLSNDITLGSIKLLVKGNPSAVQFPDSDGALPLHLASQQSESAISVSIVKYLLGFDTASLGAVDEQGNTALHYACRGANHAIVVLLTETYGAVSVSKRNMNNQLPIHLLLESPEVRDREGIEYTDSIFRLIRAYPETVMNPVES